MFYLLFDKVVEIKFVSCNNEIPDIFINEKSLNCKTYCFLDDLQMLEINAAFHAQW